MAIKSVSLENPFFGSMWFTFVLKGGKLAEEAGLSKGRGLSCNLSACVLQWSRKQRVLTLRFKRSNLLG